MREIDVAEQALFFGQLGGAGEERLLLGVVYFALLIEEELSALLSGVEPVVGDASGFGGGVGGFDFGEAGGSEEALVLAGVLKM